jgi:hypothetical protein
LELHFHPTYKYLSKDLDTRRKDEINAYSRFKNDKSVVTQDNYVYYYLVCSKWIEKWKKFANGERIYPGTN